MHLSLLTLAAALPTTVLSITLPRATASCNSVTSPGQADRRGASMVAQQLIDDANASSDKQTGGILHATKASYTTVATFVWHDEAEDRDHETYVQIKVADDADTDEAEIDRRNVYGSVMDLIYGCSNRACAEPGCPVSGEMRPNSNPIMSVRLAGNVI